MKGVGVQFRLGINGVGFRISIPKWSGTNDTAEVSVCLMKLKKVDVWEEISIADRAPDVCFEYYRRKYFPAYNNGIQSISSY